MVEVGTEFLTVGDKFSLDFLLEPFFDDILNFGVIAEFLAIDVDSIIFFDNLLHTFLLGIRLALTIDQFLQQVAILKIELHIPGKPIQTIEYLIIIHGDEAG